MEFSHLNFKRKNICAIFDANCMDFSIVFYLFILSQFFTPFQLRSRSKQKKEKGILCGRCKLEIRKKAFRKRDRNEADTHRKMHKLPWFNVDHESAKNQNLPLLRRTRTHIAGTEGGDSKQPIRSFEHTSKTEKRTRTHKRTAVLTYLLQHLAGFAQIRC